MFVNENFEIIGCVIILCIVFVIMFLLVLLVVFDDLKLTVQNTISQKTLHTQRTSTLLKQNPVITANNERLRKKAMQLNATPKKTVEVHASSQPQCSHSISFEQFSSSILPSSSSRFRVLTTSISTDTHRVTPMNDESKIEINNKIYHGLNFSVKWLKELDALDEYMVNISKYHFTCGQPKNMTYCTNITNDVPKDLSKAVFFQDSVARAAVDTLNLLTEGGTTSCEGDLKTIFCKQKFPTCNEFQETITWDAVHECWKAIDKCSAKAKEQLKAMKICEKLSEGTAQTKQCIPYMLPPDKNHCSLKNVSSWLYHAGVEINSLLNFQFTLNEKLTTTCKEHLTDYLCYSGLRCHSKENQNDYVRKMKKKCLDTVQECKNQSLSSAIQDLFLKCDKYR